MPASISIFRVGTVSRAADQRILLTAIATVIENREMPPHKYVLLHPEAQLSAEDSIRVIEWVNGEITSGGNIFGTTKS